MGIGPNPKKIPQNSRKQIQIPEGIQICFPLFWGNFLGLGPIPSSSASNGKIFLFRKLIGHKAALDENCSNCVSKWFSNDVSSSAKIYFKDSRCDDL